ncbi:inner membrane protein [Atlantibacter hermannii]|nr:inner membrane protein [Atlantibacter hermannii]
MSWQHFKQQYLVKFWAPLPAVIAAGILSTYYFGLTGTFWAVTGEFTRWGGQLLQLMGVHAEEWGYFKNYPSRRHSPYPHRRHDDYRHVRRLLRRRAVGQQR